MEFLNESISYKITVLDDGEVTWVKTYPTALDAAMDYVKFVDHGDAKYERIVRLTNSDGYKRETRFSTIGLTK